MDCSLNKYSNSEWVWVCEHRVLCQDLFRSMRDSELIQKVLHDLKITKPNVHDTVLVSCSMCIPCILKLMSECCNSKAPNKSIDPGPNEANSAAIQAAILSGDTYEKTQDLLLLDVAPCPSVSRPPAVS